MSKKEIPIIDERYAADVIGTKPELYCGIKIEGVHEDAHGICHVANADERPDFYSVYLQCAGGNRAFQVGEQCCGDFSDPIWARAYALELNSEHGWPITDLSKSAPAS
jgi:hypothetical protein